MRGDEVGGWEKRPWWVFFLRNKKESVASSIRCLVSLFTFILSQIVFEIKYFVAFCDNYKFFDAMSVVLQVVFCA